MGLLSCLSSNSSATNSDEFVELNEQTARSLSTISNKSVADDKYPFYLEDLPTELIIPILEKMDCHSYKNCWTTTKWLTKVMENNSALSTPVPWINVIFRNGNSSSFEAFSSPNCWSSNLYNINDARFNNIRYNGPITLHCHGLYSHTQREFIAFFNRITYNELILYRPNASAISMLSEIKPPNLRFFYQKTYEFPRDVATIPSIASARSVIFNYYMDFDREGQVAFLGIMADIKDYYRTVEHDSTKTRMITMRIRFDKDLSVDFDEFTGFFDFLPFSIKWLSDIHCTTWLSEENINELDVKWSQLNGAGKKTLYYIDLDKCILGMGVIRLAKLDVAAVTIKSFSNEEEMKTAFFNYGPKFCSA